MSSREKLTVHYVQTSELKLAPYNPRTWTDDAKAQVKESLTQFGFVDPLVINAADNRKNVVIGGHFRLAMAKEMGINEVPVVYVNIPDKTREQELNLRLNRNVGDWDWELLASFDESMLQDVGFTSEEMDDIFNLEDDESEQFDLEKELAKLDIKEINVRKGDVYQLGDHRLMCGDSTIDAEVQRLMNGEKADLCLTDPPYILDYLHAKRHGKPTEGFGAKKNRRYLETDVLPDNFTELWMSNIAGAAKPDFSIIVYENWKNIRVIWAEMEKYFKIKNMIVWHLPNRHQGFSSKYKFFSKYDIAMVAAKGTVEYNHEEEPDGLQEEYETALYAISGKPQWEGYQSGKKIQPTDHISFNASDEKHSGQGVIFGTKPVEILLPYIKVLTKRGDLVVEPFGGSGSTLIASEKLKRRCFMMEKSPVYAEVIMKRWEKMSGKRKVKVNDQG